VSREDDAKAEESLARQCALSEDVLADHEVEHCVGCRRPTTLASDQVERVHSDLKAVGRIAWGWRCPAILAHSPINEARNTARWILAGRTGSSLKRVQGGLDVEQHPMRKANSGRGIRVIHCHRGTSRPGWLLTPCEIRNDVSLTRNRMHCREGQRTTVLKKAACHHQSR
jgi:hypothetical protein